MSIPINKTNTSTPSKKDKICAKGNKTYEVSWLYTTNRSGEYEYLYTGKEQGKDYFDSSDKIIKPGDRVMYKNKSHQNNKVKAKIIKITSPLSVVQAAAKGTTQQKFAKIYHLKFIHPPIINQKQIKTLTVNNPKLIEKIPHHKDYICLKPGEKLKDKIENKMKKTFLTEKFYKSSEEKQKPFIIEKVLAKETNGKKVLDLTEMVEPTNKYIIQSVTFKDTKKAHKSKKYSNSNNEYYRIKAKININLKNTDSKLDVGNITGFLSCDNHKQKVADIFNMWRKDSNTYITNIVPQDIGNKGPIAQALRERRRMKDSQNKKKSFYPPGWERRIDSKSGKAFYINHKDRLTSWKPPGYKKITNKELRKIKKKTRKINKLNIGTKALEKARKRMTRRSPPVSVGQKATREKLARANKKFKTRRRAAKKIQKAYRNNKTRKAVDKKKQDRLEGKISERDQKIVDEVTQKREDEVVSTLQARLDALRNENYTDEVEERLKRARS